jgi:septal ring factor EnvC (AmiA/AmiB activator)
MTLEAVKKRKEELEANINAAQTQRAELQRALAQNAADIQAINGALQDCEYWLTELTKEAMETVKELTADESA